MPTIPELKLSLLAKAITSGKDKTGKKYEKIIFNLCRRFYNIPEAKIKLDERIVGESGELRQVDVTVRLPKENGEFLIMIECKDYSNVIGIDRVDGLIGAMQDIGADRAILISQYRFTKPAINRAVGDGRIDLCTSFDSNDRYICNQITIPMRFTFAAVEFSTEYSFNIEGSTERPSIDQMKWVLDNHGEFITKEMWDKAYSALKENDQLNREVVARMTLPNNMIISLTAIFTITESTYRNDGIGYSGAGFFSQNKECVLLGDIDPFILAEAEIAKHWTLIDFDDYSVNCASYRRLKTPDKAKYVENFLLQLRSHLEQL